MMQTRRIKTPIYPCYFEMVYFDDADREDLIKKYPFMLKCFDDFYCGCFYFEGHNVFYMFLKNDKKEKLTHGIVAHESLHIVNRIFNHCKITYNTDDSQEHATYFLEFIVNEVCSFLYKNKVELSFKRK